MLYVFDMLLSFCRHKPNTMPSSASDAADGVYNEIEIYDEIGWCSISPRKKSWFSSAPSSNFYPLKRAMLLVKYSFLGNT